MEGPRPFFCNNFWQGDENILDVFRLTTPIDWNATWPFSVALTLGQFCNDLLKLFYSSFDASREEEHDAGKRNVMPSLTCAGTLLNACFKGQVTRGHQRSNFAFFNIFCRRITREPDDLQRRRQAHSIALLTLFYWHVLRVHIKSGVWPVKSTLKNSRFYEKKSLKTIDSVKVRQWRCRQRVPLFKVL